MHCEINFSDKINIYFRTAVKKTARVSASYFLEAGKRYATYRHTYADII